MQTREAPTLGIRSQKQLPQVFGYRHGRKNRHIGANRVPHGNPVHQRSEPTAVGLIFRAKIARVKRVSIPRPSFQVTT